MSSNAVASSSKRPVPSTPATQPNKRARPSVSKTESLVDEDEMRDEEDGEGEGDGDESSRAKTARKEARIIRNRESAQRSRNQRKAHLVNLERRVMELEAENRALRSGETPPPALSSYTYADREASPAQSVLSLANDLGIPPEIVNSSNGVNLANVAPPPADIDVKPILNAPSPLSLAPATTDPLLTSLRDENAALRERVSLLENLVKQVVALSNLGGVPTTTPTVSVSDPTNATESAQAFEWDTLIEATAPLYQPNNRLDATLSPSLFPVDIAPSTVITFPPTNPNNPIQPSTTELNLARHPAAVATHPAPGQALQRARNPSVSVPLEMNSARLETVARVVVALARLRGVTSSTPSMWTKSTSKLLSLRTRRMRSDRRLTRCEGKMRLRKTGMRG